MNEKTEPEKEYPYIDRPMWLYSRSSDKKILALMQQMHELLEEAQRRSYTVVGTSQDMGTGRSMARMGLQQMMRSVKEGHVRAVLVRDLTRLSHDPAVLIQILEFLQDHDTVLITTDSDLRYELYLKGLENRFFQRAARKSLVVKGVYHEHYIQSSRTFRCPHQRNQVLYGLLRFKKTFFERTYHQRKLRQSQCCYCRKVRCFRILYLVVVVIALSSFLW